MKAPKIPPNLILTALLSGGLTLVVSLIYISLCVVALIYQSECRNSASITLSGASYFWITIYQLYFQDVTCEGSLYYGDVTSTNRVLLLVAITLGASVICLITAIILIAILQTKAHKHVNSTVNAYITVCISSLVVDIIFAVHFGNDYITFKDRLENNDAGSENNYRIDVLRQGAFLFMIITLKGLVANIINIVLLILLAFYASEYRKILIKNNHSIHKLGALNAFDQRSQQEGPWPPQPSPFTRSSQVNPMFQNDDDPPRNSIRETQRSEYSNRSFDRSDSWHHSQPAPVQTSRPFSYLDEIKNPMPLRPVASSAQDGPWRRDPWPPTPSVPAPDYSPQPARRLKSALKPAYM